jgi:tetratricopeptide (TPR) repeat protein
MRKREVVALPPVAWPLLAGALLCLIQLVPLPPRLLDVVSPQAGQLRDHALIPLGLTRYWPISLDAPSTWAEVAKYLCYAALAIAASEVSHARNARSRLLKALAVSGLALSLIGIAHEAVAAKSLFGLYTFRQAQPPLLTPFGNPNHLTAFLTLTASLSLGFALRGQTRKQLAFWAGALAVQTAAALLSWSRSGIFFYLLALAIQGGVSWARRREGPLGKGSFQRAVGLLALMMVVVSLGIYMGFERALAEWDSASSLDKLRSSKVEGWPYFAKAAAEYWRAGMGRGAFMVAFPRFQEGLPDYLFTHPENFVLQSFAEFGLFGTLLLALAWLWAGKQLFRRDLSSPLDWALVCAVGALLLHDTFDFALELPGTTAAACIALGCLFRRSDSEPAAVWTRFAVPRVAWASALALLVCGWAALRAVDSVALSEELISKRVAAGATASQLEPLALAAIASHPSSYYPYAMMANLHSRKGGDPRQALAFVNRALWLRPGLSDAHRSAARALLRLGMRNQAFGEYRLAARGAQAQEALDEAARVAANVEELISAMPPEPSRVGSMAEHLLRWGRADDALGLLEWATVELEEKPGMASVWAQLASARKTKGQWEGALAAAREAEKREPTGLSPLLLRAEVLWQMGNRQEATALLHDSALAHPGEMELAFALVEKFLADGKMHRALEVLQRARPFASRNEDKGRLLSLEGRSYEAMNRPAKAAAAFETVARLEPKSPTPHYSLARAYEAMGRPEEALRELHRGIALDGPNAKALSLDWEERLVGKQRKLQAQRAGRAAGEAETLAPDSLRRSQEERSE